MKAYVSKYAKVVSRADGDYDLYEFSHLYQEFVPVRSYVFLDNANSAAHRVNAYHERLVAESPEFYARLGGAGA